MNPILKNFLSVIRRFKMAVALNILGLSVAFAAFMVIMIQLNYDYSFDKCHKDYDKIFRLEFTRNTSTQAVISRPLAERFIESSPHILAGAIKDPYIGNAFFNVENVGVPHIYEEKAEAISPEFTDVFTFDFVEGFDNALKAPDNAIIPLSLARKIFGKESAIGKQFICQSRTFTVGAIYRDIPSNSVLNNCIYVPIPENESKDNWNNSSYHTYIRVNNAVNAPQLFDNFKRIFDASAANAAGQNFNWDEASVSMRLTVLSDIHFVTDVSFDDSPKASKQILMILFAIAIVIVAIAGINFTNFSTALTPMRIKNINTQRVLGARRSTLRSAIASEAVIVSFMSYLLAIFFVILFNTTPLARLVDADLSIVAQPLVVLGTAFIALIAGVIAGLYPAFYITSFAPALVLKGSFGLSPKGKKLRNTLIGIQFAVSFALIIGASFMYLQNYFMQNSPLGYDKDEIITVNITQIRSHRDAFANQLKAYSGIEDVTFAQSLLSSADSYSSRGGVPYKGERISYQLFPVLPTFLKVMRIEITEGRDFRLEDANMQHGAFVFNETARKKYNLELNTTINVPFEGEYEIIGFIPDIKFASFRTAVEPMVFCVFGTEIRNDWRNQAYIKLAAGTNMRAAMSHIRATLAEFDPSYTFNVRFFDEVMQRLYEKEIAISSLITLFSLLAIFISIVGVFGLVVFDSECRRKEIGIRKILGASTLGIIIMFNKSYFRILVVCFVIAAPLAWYAVTRWLENFAYKTPMYWWVYLLEFVAVGMITAATVTFQNWRVANDNPVNAIKNE